MSDEFPPLVVAPEFAPKSRADQFDVQAFEGGLLALARVHHPGVHWWHGYRRVGERFGSYCYVCDTPIVLWGGNGSPPMEARTTINEHKYLHRNGVVPLADSSQRKGSTR